MSRGAIVVFLLLAAVSAGATTLVLRSGDPATGQGDGMSAQAAALAAAWKPTSDTIESCGSGDMECLSQAWSNLVVDEPAGDVLRRLDAAAAADPVFGRACHAITHRIGAAALVKAGGEVGRALAQGAPTCQGGYYHGVMQELVRRDPRPLDEVAADACRLDPTATGSLRNDCLHGLGHGLTIHLGWDLPQSLSVCDELPGSDAAGCAGGAFMEAFTPSVPGLRLRWNDTADVNGPCLSLPERDRSECFYSSGLLHMAASGGDPARFAARCDRVVAQGRSRCAESLGANVASATQRDVHAITAACALVDDVDACVIGAARSVASWRARPQDAVRLCGTVASDNADACWEGIGNIMRMVTPHDAAARARCRELAAGASQPLAWCLEGRGSTASVGVTHAAA